MTVVVTAAVIEDGGRYFLTRRQQGVHLEGMWEFPGGKCDPGESLEDCLRRELKEELGCDAVIGEEVFTVTHDYADRRVELHFIGCTLRGEPSARLGQEMRWVTRAELQTLPFPPADRELVARLAGGHR
jgi:mutator protein MutT